MRDRRDEEDELPYDDDPQPEEMPPDADPQQQYEDRISEAILSVMDPDDGEG